MSAAGYLQTFSSTPSPGPFVMGISSPGQSWLSLLTMVVFLNHDGLLTDSLTLILAAFMDAMAAMLFVLAVRAHDGRRR